MEDAFFSQLDGNAVRELLLRTELRHAALFAVSDTLRIERCSDAAQQLSGLHPMEELGSVPERQHAEYTAPVHKYTVCLHRRGGHRRNGLHGRNDPAPRRCTAGVSAARPCRL